ncbi:acyl-CoA dehydrogenase [Pseudomaricurvus alkylphenolicus]|uniref:acyl-CoA dehydrogenase C-terminal domain-containing protein n=1 Tax=Pseudomaricurvus alkylphenolicus TaxID=1306991 RepID=UPI00141E4CA6|nr:acyl-CoA dehydrogenase C-terminal domain-containing protein [Pseudomaricurvus alkylphenolicus]NIB38417.1 acyl-CoA dehydrogenase [Pseudomaricurvus alkylphenolicus]
MTDYKAPLRDIEFVMNDLLDFEQHYQAMGYEEATAELVTAILEEGAKFAERVLAPLNSVGDQQGCQWSDGEVTTPEGFRDAYQQYVAAGWPAMDHDPSLGGQGLPQSLHSVLNEFIGTANFSWSMYASLSHGAAHTIQAHASEAVKSIYLPKLVEGSWTGTMCLTEPHCGTDLGLLRSQASPNGDGSYNIQGTKIFISAGEHDMANNIVHVALARLPDAPEGSRGISLFVVPKFLPDADGNPGQRNRLSCGSLEHKMGLKGSATCVMNFDGATGFLIGQPHKGLKCMFTFMGIMRLGTALQGVMHAELGYQKSLGYARERLQMRSLSGVKSPDTAADPIIVHPDVRRMLLTQKAFAEGGRMLVAFCAQQADILKRSNNKGDSLNAEALLALLTPIGKGFLTEAGFEAANLALQCFGGHGYIQEWGVEQNVRDSRIATIYEGTTGIQALDLLGRKVVGSGLENLMQFTQLAKQFCNRHADNENLTEFVEPLECSIHEWESVSTAISERSAGNPDELGAASVDYLMFSGYVVLAYFWAKAAAVASEKLASGNSEAGFYRAKLLTAKFYFERILPRTCAHLKMMHSGSANLMALESEEFAY